MPSPTPRPVLGKTLANASTTVQCSVYGFLIAAELMAGAVFLNDVSE